MVAAIGYTFAGVARTLELVVALAHVLMLAMLYLLVHVFVFLHAVYPGIYMVMSNGYGGFGLGGKHGHEGNGYDG